MVKEMNEKEGKKFDELGVKWIGIELNNTCNIRCTFCPMSYEEIQRQSNVQIMPFNVVKKIIDEIKEDGTLDHVVLNNYGEPFLYPEFKKVLKLCKESKIRVRFGTNGTLFTPKNIDIIRLYEPDEIVISIQCFGRENYEKIKRTKIDYDEWLNQIASFLKQINEWRLKTKIQLAIAANYNNSLRNRILGLKLGDENLMYPNTSFFNKLDDFIMEFCEKRLHLRYNPEKINRELGKGGYNRYYSINENVAFDLKTFYDFTNFYTFKKNNVVSCFMPYIVVNTEGEILLCCVDYTGKTSIGNVKKNSLKEILDKKYNVFRNEGNEKAMLDICCMCSGERTYRGLITKKILHLLR